MVMCIVYQKWTISVLLIFIYLMMLSITCIIHHNFKWWK